ncbi:MAG: Fur family transcriptional regulator [Christensenellaceae bacterium]
MKEYMTTQRKRLFSFLRENPDRQYTVEALAVALCEEKAISISAIYRNINRMVEAGEAKRFAVDGSRTFLYQYVGDAECSTHLHLKCEKCGKLFHMDDPSMEALLRSAMQQNAFHIDKQKTILYGACQDCYV